MSDLPQLPKSCESLAVTIGAVLSNENIQVELPVMESNTVRTDTQQHIDEFDEHPMAGDHSSHGNYISPEETQRLTKLLKLEHENSALVLLKILWNDSWPVGVSLLILIAFQFFCYGLTKISSSVEDAFSVDKDLFFYFEIPDAKLQEDCGSLSCMMSTHDFRLLQVIIIASVAILSGLGSELFFGYQLLSSKNRSRLEWSWIYANLLFPLFILISVSVQNAFGIILGIIGMYKFGFPETTAYVCYAFTHSWKDKSTWSYILNGLGTVFHHSASIYYITAVNLKLWYPSNSLLVIPIPLCLQHATHILSFVAPTVYPFVQLGLETWFQYEAFNLFAGHVTEVSIPYCVATMITAHWMYWLAAILAVIWPVEHATTHTTMHDPIIANYASRMMTIQGTIRNIANTLRYHGGDTSRSHGGDTLSSIRANDSHLGVSVNVHSYKMV